MVLTVGEMFFELQSTEVQFSFMLYHLYVRIPDL